MGKRPDHSSESRKGKGEPRPLAALKIVHILEMRSVSLDTPIKSYESPIRLSAAG